MKKKREVLYTCIFPMHKKFNAFMNVMKLWSRQWVICMKYGKKEEEEEVVIGREKNKHHCQSFEQYHLNDMFYIVL